VRFKHGDSIDGDHCTVLTHEILRCHDSFKEFCNYAEKMIIKGQTREISYRTYNSYTSFIHHLYEFLMGCHAREAGNTEITDKKGDERIIVIENYLTHHAQRIINQYYDAIKNKTAPSWANDIKYYDVTIPTEFAKDFRKFRNKVIGHVANERTSLSLSDFYRKYHKYLYLLYKESFDRWGKRSEEFPNLKEITEFSVMLSNESG
jgi:hypothetical protein